MVYPKVYEIGDRWQKAHVDKQRTHGKLKGKKIVHEMWKKGLPTGEKYRNVFRACRDAMTMAKTLELDLAKQVKVNKKGLFFKYVNSKGKTRKNMVPLLKEVGTLLTGDTEKTEILNAF